MCFRNYPICCMEFVLFWKAFQMNSGKNWSTIFPGLSVYSEKLITWEMREYAPHKYKLPHSHFGEVKVQLMAEISLRIICHN